MVTRSKKWSPLKKKLFEKISIKMVTKFLILMKPGQSVNKEIQFLNMET